VFLAADAWVLALRALTFVALFHAAGAWMFLALFGRSLSESSAAKIRDGTRIAALAAVGLAVLHYVLTPARMAGDFGSTFDPSLEALLLQSNAGSAHIARVVGLALLAMSLDRASRLNTIVGAAGVALALVSFALMGHTVIHEQRWLQGALLLAHVVIVAFWFGALWPLRLVADREPADRAGAIVMRFSALATWSVPLIFGCGAIMAVLFIGSLAELVTPYGAMVLAKALGFAVLMALAALNKWRFGPRLAARDPAAAAGFRRSVTAEWGILAAVLMTTAVMTALFAPENLHSSFAPEHEPEPQHEDVPGAP
jgi:putative copper export protein